MRIFRRMAEETEPSFGAILDFLRQYDWIHNFTVTKFFIEEVWKSLPTEWSDVLLNFSTTELNDLPFQDGQGEAKFPDSLRQFLQTARRLSLRRKPPEDLKTCEVDTDVKRGMNPKKLHEVERMSAVVMETAAKAGCDVIVDIGSGLGYLGQVVHRSSGCPVIGVEGCEGHTRRADRRSANQDLKDDCIKNMTFNLRNSSQLLHEFEDKIESVVSDITPCPHSQSYSRSHDQSHDHSNRQSHDQSHDSIRTDIKSSGTPQSNFSKCDGNNACTLNLETSRATELHSAKGEVHSGKSEMHSGNSELHFGNSEVHFGISELQSGNSDVCNGIRGEHHGITTMHDGMKNNDKTMHDGKEKEETEKKLNSGRSVCMIGLHCCGDLTPTMLHFFLEMSSVKALCLVSCCYHKMEFDDEAETFTNFPLSKQCQDVYKEIQSQQQKWSLSPSSLRLAAQETRARWQTQTQLDHENHTRHLAYRGLWEVFCCQEDSHDSLQNIDRKIIRKADFSSFDSFVESVFKKLDLTNERRESYRQQLQEIHRLHSPHLPYIEVVTALQVVLQPVLETLVQLDRLVYLQERRVHAHLMPVFDENISPRNLALMAIKDFT